MLILVIFLASIAIGASALAITYRYQLRRRPFRVALPQEVVEKVPIGPRQHDSRFIVSCGGVELYRGPHGARARRFYEEAVPLPGTNTRITDYNVLRGEKHG